MSGCHGGTYRKASSASGESREHTKQKALGMMSSNPRPRPQTGWLQTWVSYRVQQLLPPPQPQKKQKSHSLTERNDTPTNHAMFPLLQKFLMSTGPVAQG